MVLFKRVVDIPSFAGASYTEFLTPSVVVMTTLSRRLGGHGFGDRIAASQLN